MGSQPEPPVLDPDVRRVFESLRWIVRELRLAPNPGGPGAGLSAAQIFVLHVLAEHGPLSVGELAERTATDPSSVSVVVRKLHEGNLVSKRPSPEDLRRMQVALTAKGARAAAGSSLPVQQLMIGRMERMAPADLRRLADLLGQLAPSRDGAAPMFFQD